MIVEGYPGGREPEGVGQGEALFETVTHLRPAESHLALEHQGSLQSAHPPAADQPDAAGTDQKDDPDPGWINKLHGQGDQRNDGKDLRIQPQC